MLSNVDSGLSDRRVNRIGISRLFDVTARSLSSVFIPLGGREARGRLVFRISRYQRAMFYRDAMRTEKPSIVRRVSLNDVFESRTSTANKPLSYRVCWESSQEVSKALKRHKRMCSSGCGRNRSGTASRCVAPCRNAMCRRGGAVLRHAIKNLNCV